MSQPFSSQLPSYTGQNFAPRKPFEKLQEKNGHNSPYSSHYITDAVREKYNSLIEEDKQSWNEIISVGQLTALFIEGKQILDWNPYTNVYTPRKLKRTDPQKIKAVNWMQYFCTNWQAKWNASNPDILVAPNSNADQDISKARKANAVVDDLERNMYDKWYGLHEGLMAQIFGWYGNRVRLCNRKGFMVEKPIMDEKEVQIGKGYGTCHEPGCGYSGSSFNSVQISQTDSMPLCPECGSTAVYYEPPVTQIMPFVSGTEQIRIPNVICEQLPLPACRWKIKMRMEDSSWFIYEQDLDESAVRQSLGGIRLPDGGTPNELGLDVMRSLAAMGAPLGGRSNTTSKKGRGLVGTEMYLGPEDLWDIRVKGDEETIDGQTLPQGARLSEVFPNGACFVGLNGFSLLTGIHAEHHSDTHNSAVYHMKPLSGTGRGVADAVEGQKRFNRQDSANAAHFDSRARPATLHAEGAIPPNKLHLLGQPDVDIPIAIQNFPEARSISDLIMPLQGQSIPGDVMQYTYQHLQNFMQFAFHTTNLGGMPPPQGTRNDTATYAEISDANADALFSPALDLKADMYLKTAKKAFALWAEVNKAVKRFIPFENAAKSGARGLADVTGADVAGDYIWSWVPGSQAPKNRRTKQNDKVQFYSLFGGITGYYQAKQMFPQDVADSEREFDLDSAMTYVDDVAELCRTRFEAAKELLGQSDVLRQQAEASYGVAVPPADPMLILPEVKPSMLATESDHDQKAKWFSKLLDTPEGQSMSDSERELVSAFVIAHMQLAQGQAIAVQTGQNEVAVASNAPIQAQDQQNAAQSAQLEAQKSTATAEAPPGPDPEAEAQRQHDMASQALDIENSEAERQLKRDLSAQQQKKTEKKTK